MNARSKIFDKIAASRHRYHRLRPLAMAVSLAVLFAVPLLGIVRIDLWGGQHLFRGRPVSFGGAVVGSAIAVAVFYGVTYVVNMSFARLYCGWGCPAGEVSRLGDASELKHSSWARRWLPLVGFSLLFAASGVLWWVDPAVLRDGSWLARSTTVGAWLFLTAAAVLHGRFWRWDFCKKVCPIGIYYSMIHVDRSLGITFDAAAETCIQCNACDKVCPMGLPPRSLDSRIPGAGGLAIDGLPARNHCLMCGDCIQACEFVLAKKGVPAPLRFGTPTATPPSDASTP